MHILTYTGALIVQRPHNIEEGYPQAIPLVFHYGHKSPNDNLVLYNELVSTVATTIKERCMHNTNGK